MSEKETNPTFNDIRESYGLPRIENKDKEIERLTKQNKALNETYELTKKEYIRLNNIIKDVREYIEKMEKLHFDYSYEKQELLEILDKGE